MEDLEQQHPETEDQQQIDEWRGRRGMQHATQQSERVEAHLQLVGPQAQLELAGDGGDALAVELDEERLDARRDAGEAGGDQHVRVDRGPDQPVEHVAHAGVGYGVRCAWLAGCGAQQRERVGQRSVEVAQVERRERADGRVRSDGTDVGGEERGGRHAGGLRGAPDRSDRHGDRDGTRRDARDERGRVDRDARGCVELQDDELGALTRGEVEHVADLGRDRRIEEPATQREDLHAPDVCLRGVCLREIGLRGRRSGGQERGEQRQHQHGDELGQCGTEHAGA